MELTKHNLIDQQIETIKCNMARLNNSLQHGSKDYRTYQRMLQALETKKHINHGSTDTI